MIVRPKHAAICISLFLVINSFNAKSQSAEPEMKVVDKAITGPKLDYEYQFLNADSTEGIEKSFKNGKLYTEIYFKEKGKFQFVKRYDAESGDILQSDTVVNFSKMIGSSITYFPGGAIKEKQHRDTSGQVDKYEGFFPSGVKKVSIKYRNGKRNGAFTEYHTNGRVKETGKYLNDKKEGEFRFYDTRGTLLMVKKFKQDVAIK